MRFKHRYLLYRLIFSSGRCDPSISSGFLYKVIRDSLLDNFGEFSLGLALPGLQVKYWNAQTGLIIVRTARACVPVVQCSLSLLSSSSFKFSDFSLVLLNRAGTLRKTQQAAIRENKKILNLCFAAQKLINRVTGVAVSAEAEAQVSAALAGALGGLEALKE